MSMCYNRLLSEEKDAENIRLYAKIMSISHIKKFFNMWLYAKIMSRSYKEFQHYRLNRQLKEYLYIRRERLNKVTIVYGLFRSVLDELMHVPSYTERVTKHAKALQALQIVLLVSRIDPKYQQHVADQRAAREVAEKIAKKKKERVKRQLDASLKHRIERERSRYMDDTDTPCPNMACGTRGSNCCYNMKE
jgi:hypothetical protein